MLPLGAGLLFVGGFAVWMMHVTQVIPRRLFHKAWRKEHDPIAWRRYLIAYGVMAGVGALMVLTSLLASLIAGL
jgi:uncharacterized BrkB/YihY/UPF0761 family membrane protein